MHIFQILSLFPDFFQSPLATSLLGRAREKGIIGFNLVNPRNFSRDRHRHVDDRPYGGGPGMVMQLKPLADALQALPETGRIILLSARGKLLDQAIARELAREKTLTLICGRYEGVDARLEELFPIEEIRVANVVLNGGEAAALILIEAVCRFIEGFMGKLESGEEESFSNGLLEYPQFTRPENFAGHAVPEVLVQGHHAKIQEWRRAKSLQTTLAVEPELLDKVQLDANDAKMLAQLPHLRNGRNISFCLCHFPVRLEKGKSGMSSLTNLDVHDIARISWSYGMGPFFVLLAMQNQRQILDDILRHWLTVADPAEHGDRRHALELVQPVDSYEDLASHAEQWYGASPRFIVTSASWPHGKHAPKMLTPADIRKLSESAPVVLLLGTARGLDLSALKLPYARLRPLRFLNENHLSVRAAAAILADRILGDYY